MPELPEVETVCAGIRPFLEKARIARLTLNRPDLRWPFPDRMKERLEGAQVQTVRRRSKYILWDLDRRETVILHLGMSGRILLSDSKADWTSEARFHHSTAMLDKHDHLCIIFESGARLVFNDPRRFGAVDLAPTATLDAHRLLRKLGPEPLGNQFDAVYLKRQFDGKRIAVKQALLDQTIVAGLGNIYVCEALFRAGISPVRAAGRISVVRLERLVAAIREVLCDAIRAGGSSLRDYRQSDGALGYFQHRFQVYDRAGGPCHTDGCRGHIQRIIQGARSTYYCNICQR